MQFYVEQMGQTKVNFMFEKETLNYGAKVSPTNKVTQKQIGP